MATNSPLRLALPNGAGAAGRAGALLIAAALTSLAAAVELTPTARREIAELLQRIEASGCQFNRSGSWYTGPEARAHLQRKYDYLLARQQIGTAEDFVTHAATRSSMSGEAYLMRCGQAAPTPAAAWLGSELLRLRTAAPNK